MIRLQPMIIGVFNFMKTITIKSRKHGNINFFIDDEDFEFVNKHKWYVRKTPYTDYIFSNINGKTTTLHRLIMNVTDPKILVDHKDRNGLNNTRSNLRLCNNSENQKNKKASGNSKYLGVYFHTSKMRYFRKKTKDYVVYIRQGYIAHIKANGKYIHLGYFKDEVRAAMVYNEAAKKYHGEFANLNEI